MIELILAYLFVSVVSTVMLFSLAKLVANKREDIKGLINQAPELLLCLLAANFFLWPMWLLVLIVFTMSFLLKWTANALAQSIVK